MPGEENISVEDNENEGTTPTAEQLAAEEAQAIASSEKSINWSDDPVEDPSTKAPTDGNSDKSDKAVTDPTDGQPEDDATKKPDGETATPEDKADNAESEDGTPSDEDRDAELAEIRKAAGLAPVKGDELYSNLESKYVAASKESHRLIDEANAVKSALADAGVQVIKKEDGTLGIAPTEKYSEDLDVSAQCRKIFEHIPEDLKRSFDDDEGLAKVVEHVAKETNKIIASQRPSVNASEDDIRLPDRVVDLVFSDMANIKLGEGENARAFYADLDDNDVVDMMLEHYNSPSSRDFLITAHKNEENMKWFLDALHGKVFRGRAPYLAAKKDAELKAKKDKEKKRSEASVGTKGDPGNSGSQTKKNDVVDEAAAIARSGSSDW